MNKKIILGVTGSIAAHKAADIVTSLKKGGSEVQVIMTRAAQEFIKPLTFQSLSGRAVLTDFFKPYEDYNPVHVKLAEWADAILVAPVCADFIGKIANGIVDDLLSCTIYASKSPVLFAPAMNTKMWEHPVTRENVEKLKKIGYHFVGPVEGRLASGYVGMGRLAPVEDIIVALERLLSK